MKHSASSLSFRQITYGATAAGGILGILLSSANFQSKGDRPPITEAIPSETPPAADSATEPYMSATIQILDHYQKLIKLADAVEADDTTSFQLYSYMLDPTLFSQSDPILGDILSDLFGTFSPLKASAQLYLSQLDAELLSIFLTPKILAAADRNDLHFFRGILSIDGLPAMVKEFIYEQLPSVSLETAIDEIQILPPGRLRSSLMSGTAFLLANADTSEKTAKACAYLKDCFISPELFQYVKDEPPKTAAHALAILGSLTDPSQRSTYIKSAFRSLQDTSIPKTLDVIDGLTNNMENVQAYTAFTKSVLAAGNLDGLDLFSEIQGRTARAEMSDWLVSQFSVDLGKLAQYASSSGDLGTEEAIWTSIGRQLTPQQAITVLDQSLVPSRQDPVDTIVARLHYMLPKADLSFQRDFEERALQLPHSDKFQAAWRKYLEETSSD